MTVVRRTGVRIRLLTALASVLVLAGCGTVTAGPGEARGGDAEPSVDDSTGTGELLGVGMVLDDGDGPEFCLGAVAESLPPQCGGPELRGWDWGTAGDMEHQGGTTWTGGSYALTGIYDGTTFTVTRPPVPADQYDGPHPGEWSGSDEPRGTPCPEPEGGWRPVNPTTTTMAAFDAAAAAATRLDGYGDSWVDYLRQPETEAEALDPQNMVLNVRVVDDPASATAELRKTWGGPLCVTRSLRSDRQLRSIHRALWDTPGILSSGPSRDQVHLTVIHDDGSLQRRLDEEFGPGIVRVHSALVPLGDLTG